MEGGQLTLSNIAYTLMCLDRTVHNKVVIAKQMYSSCSDPVGGKIVVSNQLAYSQVFTPAFLAVRPLEIALVLMCWFSMGSR